MDFERTLLGMTHLTFQASASASVDSEGSFQRCDLSVSHSHRPSEKAAVLLITLVQEKGLAPRAATLWSGLRREIGMRSLFSWKENNYLSQLNPFYVRV